LQSLTFSAGIRPLLSALSYREPLMFMPGAISPSPVRAVSPLSPA